MSDALIFMEVAGEHRPRSQGSGPDLDGLEHAYIVSGGLIALAPIGIDRHEMDA